MTEERFMKPAAAGIIEKQMDGKQYVLLQDREKEGAESESAKTTNETQNLRWVEVCELKTMLETQAERFFPMQVMTLKKYLGSKKNDPIS